MSQGNQISFTVNNINTQKKNHMDGMIALKKIQHYSYALSDQIGLGYSSHVYKGKNDKTNQIVAIKVIDMKKQDDLHKQFTNDQIAILEKIKTVNAQYLLKLEGVFKTKNNLYIITQFCQGKDVAKILRKRKTYSQSQAQGIMKQFLKGYAELYKLKIVHRDLKLANIFIRKGKAILADFGFAIDADRCKDKFDYNVGSPFYMPPESLKFNKYSYKSDVWAIGIIAYELIYGKRPWKDRDDDILIEKITNQNIQDLFEPEVSISQNYKNFIRECLRVDYDRRATPEFVINYEWNQAGDYIDGLQDNSNPYQRPVSLAKVIPNIQPASAKNVTYKPIIFEQMKHRKYSQQQRGGQTPHSLINKQYSPQKEATQIRKNSWKSDNIIQIHQKKTDSFISKKQPLNNKVLVQETDTQKIILSQIHYCRFLNNVLMEIQSLGLNNNNLKDLSNQIAGKILQKIDHLSKLQIQNQQTQKLIGFRKYSSNPRWRKLNQMICDYRMKYFNQLSYLPIRQSQTLSVDLIKNNIIYLKNRISQNQRLLQLITFLYQVYDLETQKSLLQFSKQSRIEYLAQNRNLGQNDNNNQRLIKKLINLGF